MRNTHRDVTDVFFIKLLMSRIVNIIVNSNDLVTRILTVLLFLGTSNNGGLVY